MRRFQVLRQSFINGQLAGPGTIVDLPDEVRAGPNLGPVPEPKVPPPLPGPTHDEKIAALSARIEHLEHEAAHRAAEMDAVRKALTTAM